jgi:manganese-dependent inorganic pyrophosphatase
MNSPVYVIGHINPDTDSIASAIGYAWLLREKENLEAIPARAGAVNPQSAWLLKFLGLDAPILLADASPKFESVMRRFDTTSPNRPLREAWAIANRTGGIAPIQNSDGTPYGLVTGRTLFEFFSKQVGPHPHQEEMRVSEILDLPCQLAADDHVPFFQASTRIRDVLNRILREERDEFWVVDDNKKYLGICRQRDLLNPPRLKLILVDHNEAQQAIASLAEAELLEVVDHHRLGNPSTHLPIKFSVDVVGSTSTLISERVEEAGLSLPAPLAGLLLGGLLSDTLILNSPTTTERDKKASSRLARWAFIGTSILASETIDSFGKKVLSASAGLGTRSPIEVVSTDMKVYHSGEYDFSISQVEISDRYELNDKIDLLISALETLRTSKGYDFSILMVTDVVENSSRLLLNNTPPILEDLPYPPMPDGSRFAKGVVSRKKQLLPAILGYLEV